MAIDPDGSAVVVPRPDAVVAFIDVASITGVVIAAGGSREA